MKINFFENDIEQANNSGVYAIKLVYIKGETKKETMLYIGESYSMIIRCAEHLNKFKNKLFHFGFDEEIRKKYYENIELHFLVLKKCPNNKTIRKAEELKQIKIIKPILQSYTSDRQKKISKMIESVKSFLGN